MKCIKLMISTLVILLLSANSYANETGYEVELIIYEDATKRYIESEDWSYNDMLNQTNDAVFNAESVEPDDQYRELEWDGAVLSDALQKIQESPGFNVLLTKRWRQTGLDRDKAYSVEIEAQLAGIQGESSVTSDTLNNIEKLNNETASVDEAMRLPAASINGYVRLVMSRYLHFEVNLNYSRLLQSANSQELNDNVFPVVAERRMRSREIHYIDHPLVGIIVHATPYTINKESQ